MFPGRRALGGLLATLLVVATPAGAQSAEAPAARVDSIRLQLDSAVALRDTVRIAASIARLDAALAASPGDARLLHYRGYATYRLLTPRLMAGSLAGSTSQLVGAIADLEQSAAALPWPESYSLLSSLTGLRISADPSLGAELGSQFAMWASRAMQSGGTNPRVLLLQAQAALNTPPEYGGGVEPARALVARALAAFATDKPAPLAPAWGRDEAMRFQATLR